MERIISVDLAISISLAHMYTVQKSTFVELLILAMRILLFSCLLNVSSRDSKALLRFAGLLAVLRASLFKVKA